MAVLHKEFIGYNKELKLTQSKSKGLKKSRKDIRKKIRKWFKDNKPEELQPKFYGQGSHENGIIVNPIPEKDDEGNTIIKYDLDDGIYFIEKEDEDNRREINTWYDWVFKAVENHTGKTPIKKNTCVRVIFADGHHIDLPVYYKKDNIIEHAHRSKGWHEDDPKKFNDWVDENIDEQKERIIRFFKGWKNYREINNSKLKLPSGFELVILSIKYYVEDDNDDEAFRETVRNMYTELNGVNGFQCINPIDSDEDMFKEYSETRKNNFLNTLKSLLEDLDKANEEKNFKVASEILRKNQLGERFPLGEDKDEEDKARSLGVAIGSSIVKPKPYGT